ncbi:MAG TPA: hypothetical protein VFG53_19910 [Anaeromyxobacter sp.]|nr:hypothetical protein [Anaeromyxobacter sp.]
MDPAARRTLDVPIPGILKTVASSPRLPALTVRNVVAEALHLTDLAPESISVSPSLYASLRDRTRLWARENARREVPELYPSVRCDRAVPRNIARVGVANG